jgi:hypothetical protein
MVKSTKNVKTMLRVRFAGLPAVGTLAAILCFSPGAFASGVVTSATESALVATMTGGGAVTFAVNGTIYLTNTLIVSNNTVMDATRLQRGDQRQP